MAKIFANSGDPDQTPHSAASDLGLHCLPITFQGVSRLQWVNYHHIWSCVHVYCIQPKYSDSVIFNAFVKFEHLLMHLKLCWMSGK